MEGQKEKRRRAPMTIYPEEFKRKVIEDYLSSGMTKRFILSKYGIKYSSALQMWMRQLGYKDKYQRVSYFELKNYIELAAKFSKQATKPSADPEGLARRIRELEQRLEDEQLRSEAYRRMIEIAEKDLKISIRKKSGTR
jgi:transposase-like protein